MWIAWSLASAGTTQEDACGALLLYCWWHTGWREDGGTASIEPRASSLDTLI